MAFGTAMAEGCAKSLSVCDLDNGQLMRHLVSLFLLLETVITRFLSFILSYNFAILLEKNLMRVIFGKIVDSNL